MLGGIIPMGKLFLEPYSMTKWHVMIRQGWWRTLHLFGTRRLRVPGFEALFTFIQNCFSL